MTYKTFLLRLEELGHEVRWHEGWAGVFWWGLYETRSIMVCDEGPSEMELLFFEEGYGEGRMRVNPMFWEEGGLDVVVDDFLVLGRLP